jgi:uncharacterized protein
LDIRTIKAIALQYREILVKENIHPDVIVLFGSHAKGTAGKDSDIDLAIISRDFGTHPDKERQRLNLLAYEIPAPLEVIPVSLKDYMKQSTTSPILDQIFKTGIVLF